MNTNPTFAEIALEAKKNAYAGPKNYESGVTYAELNGITFTRPTANKGYFAALKLLQSDGPMHATEMLPKLNMRPKTHSAMFSRLHHGGLIELNAERKFELTELGTLYIAAAEAEHIVR